MTTDHREFVLIGLVPEEEESGVGEVVDEHNDDDGDSDESLEGEEDVAEGAAAPPVLWFGCPNLSVKTNLLFSLKY